MLERLGGLERPFYWRDLRGEFGVGVARAVIYVYRDGGPHPVIRSAVKGGRLCKPPRAVYELTESGREEGRAFLSDRAAVDALRIEIAKEAQEAQERDERELRRRLDAAAKDTPWARLERRRAAERRFLASDTGRCREAIREAGRPLSRAELRAALGKEVNKRTFTQAVQRGHLVRVARDAYALPAEAEPTVAEALTDRLLLLLAAHGSLPLAEVAKLLGIPRRSRAKRAMRWARDRGLAERAGEGDYRLTERGLARAREVLRQSAERRR